MGPKLVDFQVAIKCTGLCGELQSKPAIQFPSFGSAEERRFCTSRSHSNTCSCSCFSLCPTSSHTVTQAQQITAQNTSSPTEPAILFMNNRNKRSCRTIVLHIPKTMASWYTVKNKTEKPQLNFKKKTAFSHFQILTFLYIKNLLKVTVLQLITEKNIQN